MGKFRLVAKFQYTTAVTEISFIKHAFPLVTVRTGLEKH